MRDGRAGQRGGVVLGALAIALAVAAPATQNIIGGGGGGGNVGGIGMTKPIEHAEKPPWRAPQPDDVPAPEDDGKWRVFVIPPADGLPPETIDTGPGPSAVVHGSSRSPVRPGSMAGAKAAAPRGASDRGRSDRGRSDRNVGASRTNTGFVADRAGMWATWWEHNDDRLLDIKRGWGPGDGPSTSGSLGVLTSRGRRTALERFESPPDWIIRDQLMPLLFHFVDRDDEPLLVSAALMTLARATPADDHDPARQAMTSALAHPVASVRATAALALGILGDERASPDLRALALDDPHGRRLIGGGSVGWLTRSTAALSLGLIGSDGDVQALIGVFEASGKGDRDLQAATLVALGLIEGPRSVDAAAFLTGLLDDRGLDPVVAAQVPVALARLGAPGALATVTPLLGDEDAHSHLRQSAALALGILADLDDGPAVERLMEAAREDRDEHVRHFAMTALGRVGMRSAAPRDAEAVDRLGRFFVRELEDPSRFIDRSWAALGVGLFGRRGEATAARFEQPLTRAYRRESDPDHKSAYAIALGLLERGAAGDAVLEDLRDRRDEEFRGFAAVALGLLDHVAALDDLQALSLSRAAPSVLRRRAATGQALMGDRSGTAALMDMLARDDTVQGRGAATGALAIAGDARAMPQLLAIAKSEREPVISRAYACVALGLVCERTPLPWNTRLAEDHNYIARVSVLERVLDVL